MFGIFVKHTLDYSSDVSFINVCDTEDRVQEVIQATVEKHEFQGFVVESRAESFARMHFDDDEVIEIFTVPVGGDVVSFVE